jgi:hypothetical protein
MLRTEATMQAVTIREARPADSDALEQLAALDSTRPLRRPALVAEVAGELWAAVSVAEQRVIADPFRPSGELGHLLTQRARQVAA